MSPRPQRADHQDALARLDGEAWLARRLGKHGVLVVFGGDTTPEQRMKRIRECIVNRELEAVICGHKDGKSVRYAEAFERLYGEPL